MADTSVPSDYQAEIGRDFLGFVPRPWWCRGWLARLPWLERRRLAGAKVLVVGCARGRDCTFFVEAGSRDVHGLDVVEDIGADFRHPSVTYHRCSAERMELPSDTFDLVYSVATMEHVPHIEPAYQEMVRVARPGGMIYCFASPLWNSVEGHHKFGMFPGQGWIHLRHSRDELVAYCREQGIRASGDHDVADDVDFIFSSYFNREPSTRYTEVCARLPVSRLVKNEISRTADEALGEEVLAELAPKGYGRDELLALWHKLVAVK
jgi:SAM-dependent methyltransferase